MMPITKLYRYVRDKGMGRALRHRDFALFSLTGWLSTIGFWIQRLAVGWLTWELTHSAAWLGAMALAHALPPLFLTPFTGAVADRLDRLVLMRYSQSASILLNSLLAGLVLADAITVEIMFLITLATGIAVAFNMPARMTIAPALVPREDLSAAIAVNSFLWQSSAFLGPAIAGVLVAAWGLGPAFVANVLSFLPFYAILFVIKLTHVDQRARGGKSLLADVVEGLRYCATHKGIGPVIASALVISLLSRPLTDLLPGFVGAVFDAGPTALGNLMSLLGVGGMVGSLWMANRNRIGGTTTIYLAGAIGVSALTIGFTLTPSLGVAMAIMVGLGFTGSMTGNAAQTLVQNSVEGSFRARVLGLLSLSHQGPAVGAMVLGAAATWLGLQASVAFAAAIGLVFVLWLARGRGTITRALEAPHTTPERLAGEGSAKAAE